MSSTGQRQDDNHIDACPTRSFMTIVIGSSAKGHRIQHESIFTDSHETNQNQGEAKH